MADYLPQNNGNWSTTTWITAFSNLTAFAGGNTPPTVIDDVYADGKTINIDINTRVNTIRTTTTPRTGGLAGGGFRIDNGLSLSANCLAGTTTCLTFLSTAPNTATLVGNVTGSATTNVQCFNNNTTGTFTILGNVRAGVIGGGAINTGTGTLNISGNCIGGGGGAQNFVIGVTQNGGTVNIIGNCIGSDSSGTGHFGFNFGGNNCTLNLTGNCISSNIAAGGGIRNSGQSGVTTNILGNVFGSAVEGYASGGVTSTINITGSVIGGLALNAHGIGNTSGSTTITVVGSAIGGIGSNANGINNSSTSTVFVTRAIGNGFGLGSVGVAAAAFGLANSQNGRAYVEQVEFGPRGATPISGPVYILPSNRNTLTGYTTALGQTVTFYNSLSVSGLLPPVSSVRQGTVYNVGNSTGTMAVPSASAVQFGIPVDNTVGTAALTPQSVWGYSRLSATEVDSMGDRLRNTATTQSVGYQIASFNL